MMYPRRVDLAAVMYWERYWTGLTMTVDQTAVRWQSMSDDVRLASLAGYVLVFPPAQRFIQEVSYDDAACIEHN